MDAIPEVVLVEDNPTDMEMTRRALRKVTAVHRLVTFRDGEAALQYMFSEERTDDPRVILLDLKLPKVDGIEVLQKLKQDERTKSVPVVVLTSSAEERDRLATYRLGANSYIVKPVEYETFMKAIGEVGMYWLFLNQASR